jgi:hypothetical protein
MHEPCCLLHTQGLRLFSPTSSTGGSTNDYTGDWTPGSTGINPTFDLSNNKLSTSWPTWLQPALFQILDASGSNSATVNASSLLAFKLSGGSNLLKCPAPLVPTPTALPDSFTLTQAAFNLTCTVCRKLAVRTSWL